jgi:hypothetical protein
VEGPAVQCDLSGVIPIRPFGQNSNLDKYVLKVAQDEILGIEDKEDKSRRDG